MTTNKQLQAIVEQCLKRSISPQEAIQSISDAIGGIQGISYSATKGLKIHGPDVSYSIQTTGYRKKEAKLIPIIAVLGYELAKEKGSRLPGEIHISRQASTKHHKEGIEKIIKKYSA